MANTPEIWEDKIVVLRITTDIQHQRDDDIGNIGSWNFQGIIWRPDANDETVHAGDKAMCLAVFDTTHEFVAQLDELYSGKETVS